MLDQKVDLNLEALATPKMRRDGVRLQAAIRSEVARIPCLLRWTFYLVFALRYAARRLTRQPY